MSFTNWWFSEVGGGDEGVENFVWSSQVNNIEPRPKVAAKNRFTTPHLVNIARDCGEHVPPEIIMILALNIMIILTLTIIIMKIGKENYDNFDDEINDVKNLSSLEGC